MPRIGVTLDGDHQRYGERLGLFDNQAMIGHTMEDWDIDVLKDGTAGGMTSLVVHIPVVDSDGAILHVLAETTLQCWMMATDVLVAACADEIKKPGWMQVRDENIKAVLTEMLVSRLVDDGVVDTPALGRHLVNSFFDVLAAPKG